MIFEEVGWIRNFSYKLSPFLQKEVLELYRPYKRLPCFLQKPLKSIRQRFKKIPVIVSLAGNEKLHAFGLELSDVAHRAGCKIKHDLSIINAFSTVATTRTLEKLCRDHRVARIWYDRAVHAVLDVAAPTVQAPSVWADGYTGKDIVVAVVDTGIYPHPDLTSPTNRIIAFKDVVNNRSSPYDDNGHGTHVAGDVASNGLISQGAYRGPAPEASLVGIKVLDKYGSGSESEVIAGLTWAVKNKEQYNIRVLSMSLGSTASVSYRDDPLAMAVEAVWREGIVVCVAAGNSGPGEQTIDSPGTAPSVITVGASDDMGTIDPADDTVAYFSSRGPTIDGLTKPDVAAPGVNIVSLRAPGSLLAKKNKDVKVNNWYLSLSGTSMSTPVCSGVCALLLEANPQLAPDKVKEILTGTAMSLNDAPNVQGAGLIDAEKAVMVATSSFVQVEQ